MGRYAVIIVALMFSLTATFAQKKKDEPKPSAPKSDREPTLTTPVTMGLTSGQSSELELTGTHLDLVDQVRIETRKIKTTILSKEATKLRVKCEVESNDPIGIEQLRVLGPTGISAFRPITIDNLPSISDNGKNTQWSDAQTIAWPCVVTGSIANETADFYRVAVKAGQTVTFDCFAKRLGSLLDPALIIVDAKTGREYASLFADDTPGLQSDARLVHTFTADGEYLVSVRDTTYKGGEKYDYRLRVTQGPPATMAIPRIVQSGKETTFEFVSQTGQPIKPLTRTMTKSGTISPGGHAWPVPVGVTETPQIVDPKSAKPLSLKNGAIGITAIFEAKNDVDRFMFEAKKDEKFELIARTAEIGSPCEIAMKIVNASGATLAQSDPQKTTARIDFTSPGDGVFTVTCEHLNFLFGPQEVYHLTIAKAKPDWSVTAATDRVMIPNGGFGLLPIVAIQKQHGFDATIPLFRGMDASKENPVFTPMTRGIIPNVDVSEISRQAMNGLPYLPPGWESRIATATVNAIPATFEIGKERTIKAGEKANVVVKVDRKGFEGEISLSLVGLPANVTAKPVTLEKSKSEATLEIVVDAKAASSVRDVYLKATSGDSLSHAGPLTLTVKASEKKDEPKPTPKKP